MGLASKIAKRYLVSKKSTNAINIISGVAVAGIAVATMAFIIILSVFNGFEDFVASLYHTFNPDLKVEIKEGKSFVTDSTQVAEILQIDGVKAVSGILEENAVVTYNDKPKIVTIKGVDPNYRFVSQVDTTLVNGQFLLRDGEDNYAVIGYGIEAMLGVRLFNQFEPLYIYMPRRGASTSSLDPTKAFNKLAIKAAGSFSIQADFDSRYIIVPLRFARELMMQKEGLSSLEISFDDNASKDYVQSKVQNILGPTYSVKNRYQQDEFMYKVMQAEKWAVFAILTLVLLITAFNIVGSLSMLVIEKKKDISILKAMGASSGLINRIFLMEGLLLAAVGAISGMGIAALICFIQQKFKVIKLQGNTFLIDAYPVSMRLMDFVWVALAVTLIAVLASYIPARKAAAQSQLLGD